jgi:hypothetical protein
MNTKNIYIEYRNFERFNKLCYINTVFSRVKQELRKKQYKCQISLYGAISNNEKILPMRFEIFAKRNFTRKDINTITAFIYMIRPIGYTICKYVRGVLYPIVMQFEIEKMRGV